MAEQETRAASKAEPLVTFFATKEKFFKNSKRIGLLSEKGFKTLEGGSDTKMYVAYRDIQGVGAAPKPTNFSLKTPQMNDTYICDTPKHRDDILNTIYDFRRTYGRKSELKMLHVAQLKSLTGEEVEVTLAISNVDIAKKNGDTVYSAKYLKDLKVIYGLNDSFILEYTDGSRCHFKCKGEPPNSVVNYIKSQYRKYFHNDIQVKAGDAEALMPQPIELMADERLFGFPIKKYSKRLDTTLDRVLCFTATDLCVCDASRVVSTHPLKSIAAVRIFEGNPDKFTIEYSGSTKSTPSQFFSTGRDTILANLLAVSSDERSVIFDFSGTHPKFHLRGSVLSSFLAVDPEAQEYFLRRLAKVTATSNSLDYVLKEFCTYIHPKVQLVTKDRRGLEHMFEVLRYMNTQFEKGQAIFQSQIVDVLQVTQRLLNSRVNYTEVRAVKDIVRILSDLLRSNDELVASAAALTSLSILEMPKHFDAKAAKLEAGNKAALLTDEFYTTVLSSLVQNAFGGSEQVLRIYTLLEVLISIFSTHASTTDDQWFHANLSKLSRGVSLNALFSLCKSPCFAVALKASNLLKTVFHHAPADLLPSIQDAARQQLAVIYHLCQAVDSRLKPQRTISGDLTSMMVENNNESMALLSRIVPSRFVEILDSTPSPAQVAQGRKKPIKQAMQRVIHQSTTPKTKKNWGDFFEALMSDVRQPDMYWNADTRKELAAKIDEEITLYERDSQNNRDRNKVWNYEEFRINYRTLEKELIVDDMYVRIILDQPENAHIRSPRRFLIDLFHKLLVEKQIENKIVLAKCMGWCFNRYVQQIGAISYMENIVNTLDSAVKEAEEHSVSANTILYDQLVEILLEFLNYTFSIPENCRLFIHYNGLSAAASVLKSLNKPPVEAAYSRALVCLDVLNKCARLVESVDEKGFIKIPIPRAKQELASVQAIDILRCIGQAMLVKSVDVAGKAAILLDRLLENNSAVASVLHRKTGIIYFILLYNEQEGGAAMMKLLQTIHNQSDPHQLRRYLPDSIVTYLAHADPEEFASVFLCQSMTGEVIWTQNMRDRLVSALRNHLSGFFQSLSQNPYALYNFEEMDSVEYPDLEQELRCGGYYIRNILVHPDSTVECPEEVLRDALRMLGQVDEVRQAMLLKACSILYKNYHKLAPFRKFDGYPIVMSFLALDRNRPNLSSENLQLMEAALDCVFYSVWASQVNLKLFLENMGMSHLGTLLWCCSRNISISQCQRMIAIVFRVIIRLIGNNKAREQVTLNNEVVTDILSCLTVGQPKNIVVLAMQCVLDFSQAAKFAEFTYKRGAHLHLLDFILSFDPQEDMSSPTNELAVRAAMVLGSISGIFQTAAQTQITPTERKFQNALRVLLTPGIVAQMAKSSEVQLLQLLTHTYELPYSIWNEDTRNELVEYVHKRIGELQRGDTEADELKFQYQTHLKEMQVCGVFLRPYVQHVDVALENPREFLVALLREVEMRKSEPGNLDLVLRSILSVLHSTQGLEKNAVTPDALGHFLEILRSSNEQHRAIVLSIFLHVTANQLCVDSICSLQILHEFSLFFQRFPDQVRLLLDVLLNMVSSSSKAIVGVTQSGLLLHLLNLVANEQNKELRLQSVSILKQTKMASLVDARFMEAVSLFWPRYLTAVLEKQPLEFLFFYDHDTVSTNIIWNDANRQVSAKAIAAELQAFTGRQELEWNYRTIQPISWSHVNQQLEFGGVYLNIFIQNPKEKLHDPIYFIDATIPALIAGVDASLQKPLVMALLNLFTAHTAYVHRLGNFTVNDLQGLLNLLSSSPAELQYPLMRIVSMACHSPVVLKKLVNTQATASLTGLLASTADSQVEEICCMTLYLLVRKDQTFIKSLVECNGGQALVAVMDKQNNAAKYAKAVLKTMVFGKYQQAARQSLVGRDALWQQEGMPKMKPDWIALQPLPQNLRPYVAPIEMDAAARRAAESNKSASGAGRPAVAPVAAAQNTSSPTPIQPLKRSDTAPAPTAVFTHTPVKPPVPTSPAAPTAPESSNPILPNTMPVPPSKPAHLASQNVPAVQRASTEAVLPAATTPAPAPAPVPVPPLGTAPPPPPAAAPPPPPVAAPIPTSSSSSSTPSSMPKAQSGRGDLLASIRQGITLKKVETVTPEERKAQRAAGIQAPGSGGAPGGAAGGGGGLMDALAGALAARRTRLVTELAANPFESDEEEDDWDD